jgi:hypothetical protein
MHNITGTASARLSTEVWRLLNRVPINNSHSLQQVQLHRAYVVGGLRPGAALVVVCLAVVPLQASSTTQTMTGCRVVGGCEG